GRGGLGLGGGSEGGSQQARRIAARHLLHRTGPGRSRGPISAWLWDFELGGLAGASRRICRLALPRSRDRAGRGVARGARREPQRLADSRSARDRKSVVEGEGRAVGGRRRSAEKSGGERRC